MYDKEGLTRAQVEEAVGVGEQHGTSTKSGQGRQARAFTTQAPISD